MQGRCLKCREQRDISECKIVTLKNGRPAAKGRCPICGTGMFKFLKKSEVPQNDTGISQ